MLWIDPNLLKSHGKFLLNLVTIKKALNCYYVFSVFFHYLERYKNNPFSLFTAVLSLGF